MHFNAEVTLGTVIQTVALIGMLFGVYMGIRGRLDRLETKVDPIWNWFTASVTGTVRRDDDPMRAPESRRRRSDR